MKSYHFPLIVLSAAVSFCFSQPFSCEKAFNSESKTSTADSTIHDVLDHPNFYIREGNYILIPDVLEKEELLFSAQYCQGDFDLDGHCVTIHHHSVNTSALNSDQLGLLHRRVFWGDNSDEINRSMSLSFRTLNEELKDSLEGIWLPAGFCENSFFWIGGEEPFSEDHSVIYFEGDTEFNETVQWAVLSTNAPKVFSSDYLVTEEEKPLYEQLTGQEYNQYLCGVDMYKDDETTLIVTYQIEDECGEQYFVEIQLWKSSKGGATLIQDLDELPLMIFDIDKDGEFDILYDREELHNSHDFIGVDYPYCDVIDGDTVYYCGC